MRQRSSDSQTYAETRLRLLDLAEDASLYLRRSADPSVRVAAALLLAASLAACSPAGGSSSSSSAPPAVLPLAQEVREGLPTAPGVYPVSPSSLTRDAQGVYGFSWRNATGPAVWSQGRSSLMRLAQGNEDTLQIVQGQDPILRLKPDTAIAMPDDAGTAVGPTPTRSTSSSTSSSAGYYGGRSIAWYPFTTGGGSTISSGTGSTGTGSTGATESVAATTPAYRNPPAAEPGQGSVRGASSSLGAPTTSARTWTSPARAAATGQRGGPGGGSAVSSRSGSTASSSSSSGAARPSSSGFSSGRSGGISGASAAG
ncbi:MAG: hypothetical protein U0893_14715 [Chloroflexota bacterium]